MLLKVRILLSVFFLLFAINVQVFAKEAVSADSTLKSIQAIANDSARFAALLNYRLNGKALGNSLYLEIGSNMLATAKAMQSDSNMVKSYFVLGHFSRLSKDNPAAIKYFGLMLNLANKTNDYPNQIKANLAIAIVYRSIGEAEKNAAEWEMATSFVEKAMAICKAHNVLELEADILSERAIQYDLRKMHAKAIETYAEALVICRRLGNKKTEFNIVMNTGISLKNNKQFTEALASYKTAIGIADSMNMAFQKAAVTGNLANLYFEMGQYGIAEETAMKAIGLGFEVSEPRVPIDMYYTLIKMYSKQNRFEEALLYTNKLTTVKDSLFNIEKSRQIKEMQTKYDTDIKDKTIDSQTSQLAFNKKQTLFLWAGIGFLIIIAAVIFISLRRTSRLNKQISLQSAELSHQKQTLQVHKEELQQVNSVKDRLFSVISHDLRTPVNSLISFTMLLENSTITPEKLNTYASELKNNLGYTAGLMENLLNFARSQMGGFKPALENFALCEVADDTVLLLQSVAAAKNITIENNIDDAATVFADTNMTALIVRNLISNAIKYSYSGGSIHLATEIKSGQVNLLVKDSGLGMDAATVHAFNQGDGQQGLNSTPGTQQEKGTGLGLMLCKNFATLMGGKIWVERAPGKGCCFVVAFIAGNKS
jgi:signal transduction histidine kinase